MTDSILRSYQYYSTTSIVPFPAGAAFEPEPGSAVDLLHNETQGFAIEATTLYGGAVAVIDTGTPANNLSDVILDASNLTNSGTSPKMVHHVSSPYVRWSPHNLFLNSASPATQNVTLVTGFVYTYGITGTGSLAGTSGASGTATSGSPVTFTATGTTGTFTVTGSPTTMWINRGTIQVPYLATTGSTRIGIPQSYDTPASKYGILVEQAGTNSCLRSEELTNATWQDADTANVETADAIAAPDANSTADKIASGTGSHFWGLYQDSIAITAGLNTVSIYAKPAGWNWIELAAGDSSSFGLFAAKSFNASTGASGTTRASGWSLANSAITSIGDGWYRVSITVDTGGDANIAIQLQIAATDAMSSARTGDSSSGLYLWGAQVEAGIAPTSLIPTLGATQTRAADVISALDTTFPGSDTNNTIYIDYKPLSIESGTRYAWSYWKDANNFYSLAGVSADPTMGNTNAGSPQFAVDLGTLVAGTRTQITIAAKGSDFDGSQDGAAPTAQGTATLTTAYTTLYLGTFGTTGSELTGYIYRMVQVPYQRETVTSDLETWRYNF